MQISNWLATQLLNASLRGTAFSPPSTVYIALYTSDPTPADTGTEVSGGGYTRQAITFTAAALDSGKVSVKNMADVVFPQATADWGLVTHVAIRTAASGGNLLWSVPLAEKSRTIQVGDRPKFLKDSTIVRFAQ